MDEARVTKLWIEALVKRSTTESRVTKLWVETLKTLSFQDGGLVVGSG